MKTTRPLLRSLFALPVALLAFAPSATHAEAPIAGTWTMTGAMHQARGFGTATLLSNGLVLVAGGCGTCSNTNPELNLTSAELYHPRTGTFTAIGSLHDPRDYQTGQRAPLLGNGKVLVAGGCLTFDCSTLLTSAELYDPSTGAWTVTGSLHKPRLGSTATLLPDGEVLVAGGASTDTMQASAELYHP